MMRGRFITLEGGEGVGKSTQARLLAERLRSRGVEVVVTREPGGSPRAEAIRSVILSGGAKAFGPAGEAILFYAARGDHLAETILPALRRGDWVVCDRFSDSTRAYQGVAGGVDPVLLKALERIVVSDAEPDLTLILDMPVDVSLRRMAERAGGETPDRFESEAATFHEALRRAFLEIAEQEPRRCAVIDADAESNVVAARVWRKVAQRLPIADNDPL